MTVSPDEAVLAAAGELDRSVVDQVGTTLLGLIELRPGRIVLDLSAVTFIDASGLGIIAAGARRRPLPDQHLVVRAARPTVLRMLDITGLSPHLELQGRAR